MSEKHSNRPGGESTRRCWMLSLSRPWDPPHKQERLERTMVGLSIKDPDRTGSRTVGIASVGCLSLYIGHLSIALWQADRTEVGGEGVISGEAERGRRVCSCTVGVERKSLVICVKGCPGPLVTMQQRCQSVSQSEALHDQGFDDGISLARMARGPDRGQGDQPSTTCAKIKMLIEREMHRRDSARATRCWSGWRRDRCWTRQP